MRTDGAPSAVAVASAIACGRSAGASAYQRRNCSSGSPPSSSRISTAATVLSCGKVPMLRAAGGSHDRGMETHAPLDVILRDGSTLRLRAPGAADADDLLEF